MSIRRRRGRRLAFALALVSSIALGAGAEARAWGGIFTAASGELVRIDFSDDWGTKRWASYLGVCAKARAGTLFPGDQYTHYELNPGEGFAEAYRVFNERRLGSTESPWSIVDRIMYPDGKALELLAQDVREPWSAPTRISFSGSFRKGSGELRSFRVSTPLDGELELVLRGPAKAAYRLSVLNGNRVVASAPVGRRSLSVTVCGQRTLLLRVERRQGLGTFQLTASRP